MALAPHVILLAFLLAGDAPKDDPDERLQECIDRATGLLMADRHHEAAAAFKEAAALAPDDGHLAYRAARCFSLAGRKKEALEQLHAAVARGFLDLERMQAEADLAPLAQEPEYHAAVAAAHAELAKLERARAREARDEMLEALAGTEPRCAFNFDLFDVYGRPVSLPRLRGTVVIAAVFNTGSILCGREAKVLLQAAHNYAEAPPAIVGLFLERSSPEDAARAVRRFMAEQGFGVPCALIDETVVAQLPRFHGPPALLFFDKEGALRFIHTGPTTPAVFTGWLDALLDRGAKGTAVPPNTARPPKVVPPSAQELLQHMQVRPPSAEELLQHMRVRPPTAEELLEHMKVVPPTSGELLRDAK